MTTLRIVLVSVIDALRRRAGFKSIARMSYQARCLDRA